MIKISYRDLDGADHDVGVVIEYLTENEYDITPTMTAVHLLEEKGEHVSGFAYRFKGNIFAPADSFNRAIGRKIAFGRAVREFSDNKAIRRQLWQGFLDRVKV